MDFEDFCVSPLDLVALQVLGELLLGLMFCMWAALTAPGKFLSIHSHSEENRYWCIFICFHFVNWDFFSVYFRLDNCTQFICQVFITCCSWSNSRILIIDTIG